MTWSGWLNSPTREELLREVAILRQTPPRAEDILLGKYAGMEDSVSEEEFHTQMRGIATEWQQEWGGTDSIV